MEDRIYQFGELSPEQFEVGMQRRIRVRDMQVGEEYVLRSNPPSVPGANYISDYPVRIDGLREEDKTTMVALTHLAPRQPDWESGPVEVTFSSRGYVQFKNSGKRRFQHLPEGTITIGYLLPPVSETPEEYIERLARAIETLQENEKTLLIGRLAASQSLGV